MFHICGSVSPADLRLTSPLSSIHWLFVLFLCMERTGKFRTSLNISNSKLRPTLKCEHGELRIRNWSSMCSRRELTECKQLIPRLLTALAYTYNIGSDGCSVSSPTSATASERVYGVLWTIYRIHSMRHMRAHWKILVARIGNVHTDYSSALQWHPAHFASGSSQRFSPSISKKDQLLHYWPTGVRRTRHTLCYQRAPVCSPSSTWMGLQLSSLRIFQSRS